MSKRGGGGDSPPPSSLCVSWWSWGRRWASPTPPSHLSWWAWGQVRGWGWSSATVDEKAKKKKTWDRYQPREVKAIILHRKETERKGSRGSQGCRSGSKCHEKRKTKISDMDPDTFFLHGTQYGAVGAFIIGCSMGSVRLICYWISLNFKIMSRIDCFPQSATHYVRNSVHGIMGH